MAGPGLPTESAGETGQLRVGATLATAMLLWWRNKRAFVTLALVAVAPLVIATELLSRLAAPGEVKVGIAVAVLTMSVLGEVFCAGLAEHMVRHKQLGLPSQPWWTIARALPLLRLAAVSLITGAVVLCGLVLLVLPGLAAFAWLALATPLVSLERARVWAALRGSVSMVRGHFWSVVVLTTAIFVPATLADTLSEELRQAHAPLWTELAVEVVTDVLVVAVSAAVVVAIFNTLGSTAKRRLADAERPQ